jgi:hypothetical protein
MDNPTVVETPTSTELGAGELGLEQPSAARRGRVEKLSNGLYQHFCTKGGAWGAFGYAVNFRLGRLDRWYCAAHRPQGATL